MQYSNLTPPSPLQIWPSNRRFSNNNVANWVMQHYRFRIADFVPTPSLIRMYSFIPFGSLNPEYNGRFERHLSRTSN